LEADSFYKTTKEFLMRFGLKDVNELPSMEEFEKLWRIVPGGVNSGRKGAAQSQETNSVQGEEIAQSASQKE